MKMQLIDLVDCLIPGDSQLGAPCFSKVAWSRLQRHHELILAVEKIIEKYQKQGEPEQLDNQFAKSFSEFFKQTDAHLYSTFRDTIAGLYFTSKTVLAAMSEEETPLFPRGQTLPSFNFDLLECVYNRGEIWRSVTEE